MPLKNSVFEASKLVSTKTPLLKHYFRHQGKQGKEGRGSGIVSCDSAVIRIRIRIVRCQRPTKHQTHNPAKQRPVSFPHFLFVGSQESVLKLHKRGQFQAAIRVILKHCDSCAQGALERWTGHHKGGTVA